MTGENMPMATMAPRRYPAWFAAWVAGINSQQQPNHVERHRAARWAALRGYTLAMEVQFIQLSGAVDRTTTALNVLVAALGGDEDAALGAARLRTSRGKETGHD